MERQLQSTICGNKILMWLDIWLWLLKGLWKERIKKREMDKENIVRTENLFRMECLLPSNLVANHWLGGLGFEFTVLD